MIYLYCTWICIVSVLYMYLYSIGRRDVPAEPHVNRAEEYDDIHNGEFHLFR